MANRRNAPARRAGRPGPSTVVTDDDDPTAASILAAAVAVLAEHGYHGTSVRDIAARAGVSPGAIYHHFGSKQGVLVMILDRGIDRLVRRTEDALLAAGDDPADRLCAIVETHVLAHAHGRRESFIGNSELRSLEPVGRALIVTKRDAQQRMFDRVVADGVTRGAFTTPHPVEAARVIVSACTAVATWFRADGPLPAEEVARRYQRVALDTVGYSGNREPDAGRLAHGTDATGDASGRDAHEPDAGRTSDATRMTGHASGRDVRGTDGGRPAGGVHGAAAAGRGAATRERMRDGRTRDGAAGDGAAPGCGDAREPGDERAAGDAGAAEAPAQKAAAQGRARDGGPGGRGRR